MKTVDRDVHDCHSANPRNVDHLEEVKCHEDQDEALNHLVRYLDIIKLLHLLDHHLLGILFTGLGKESEEAITAWLGVPEDGVAVSGDNDGVEARVVGAILVKVG